MQLLYSLFNAQIGIEVVKVVNKIFAEFRRKASNWKKIEGKIAYIITNDKFLPVYLLFNLGCQNVTFFSVPRAWNQSPDLLNLNFYLGTNTFFLLMKFELIFCSYSGSLARIRKIRFLGYINVYKFGLWYLTYQNLTTFL
jgi:hypothetical protein